MEKTLREENASDGTRCRWNPDTVYSAEKFNEPTGVWYTANPSFVLDHRAIYDALRAEPYVRDAVVEAIEKWYSTHAPRPMTLRENIALLAATLRPLVLTDTPTDELVAELVKRGARHYLDIPILWPRPNGFAERKEGETVLILPTEAK